MDVGQTSWISQIEKLCGMIVPVLTAEQSDDHQQEFQAYTVGSGSADRGFGLLDVRFGLGQGGVDIVVGSLLFVDPLLFADIVPNILDAGFVIGDQHLQVGQRLPIHLLIPQRPLPSHLSNNLPTLPDHPLFQ